MPDCLRRAGGLHNGLQVAQQAVGTFRTATAGDVCFGGRPSSTNVFSGLMDEVSIYNRALSAAEISLIYRAGSAGKCTEPDGTPYLYFDGVNYGREDIVLVTDTPVNVGVLSTYTGGTTRCTLDGSPAVGGALYTGAFIITNAMTLRAVAFDSNAVASREVSATVTMVPSTGFLTNHVRIDVPRAGKVVLLVRAETGHRYVLQRSVDLVNWEAIGSALPSPDGLVQIWDEAPREGAAFYRMLIE